MKAQQDLDKKIDMAFEAIADLDKVPAPTNIFEDVISKLNEPESKQTSYDGYLKWAAIGLIILVNMLSYINYQEDESNVESFQAGDLATEYGLDSYAYADY